MSDYSINSISSARPVDSGAAASRVGASGPAEGSAARFPAVPGVPEAPAGKANLPAAPAATDAAKRRSAGETSPDSPAARLVSQAAAQQAQAAQEKAAKPNLPISRGDNVVVRFRVDRQTNNVTVFIVDRASKRVLRSIPPEEVGKLQAGDLLELTA